MKNVISVQTRGLLVGTVMCITGIVIFFNFSVHDFLTPGFVQKGIVLENYEIKGDSSYVGNIHVDQTSVPYTIILSDNGSPTKFDIRIGNSQEDLLHETIFKNGIIRFTPGTKGDYTISVQNQSGQPALVSLSYGMYHDYTTSSLMTSAIWVLLVIGGNYVILHRYLPKIGI